MKNAHFAKHLPAHWLDWLEKINGLSAYDFPGGIVKLDFEDGSLAIFNYAFFVVDEKRKELAVFTEHCGYHVYTTMGLTWQYFDHAESPFQLGKKR